MYKPLVSIIIPVYNGSNFLCSAIESALAQTYSNIEVLVINDGSNDNNETEKIALSFGEKVRYFNKKNGGVATALNYGIDKMHGEYFSWLSHDDYYYPDKIERQILELQRGSDLKAIVQSDYDFLNVDSNTINHQFLSHMYPFDKLISSVFPVLQGLVYGCSLLIHKSHFARVGRFNERLITTQDYEFWFRLFRDQRTVYINKPLVCCRIHENQGSRTLKCFDRERDELHINFMKQLSYKEMRDLYGSPYNFYHKMACYFKGNKMMDSYYYANSKFLEADIEKDTSSRINKLNDFIQGLSKGKASKICIFCAGQWGLRLYHELKSKLVTVDFFADNNINKQGHIIDNVQCIPYQELEKIKEETLVIIATRTPLGIVNKLKSDKFPYIITKQQMEKILLDTPPIKWISSLDNINYTNKETLNLMHRFNQALYDICRYYQGRINSLKER